MLCHHRTLALAAVMALGASSGWTRADVVLDFNDIPPETVSVFNPVLSHGFTLTSTSGGFVVNSPDTGNGMSQTVGNNPFYAGANGLAAFAPATITLTQTNGQPFSLLSIDLARNFAFDPAPSVTFTGTLAGGGTVSESFTVTTASPPLVFQTFDFTGFTNLASVSWDQDQGDSPGVHQFTNVTLSTTTTPEPSTWILALVAFPAIACFGGKSRSRSRTAS